jgi:hypothetical protein
MRQYAKDGKTRRKEQGWVLDNHGGGIWLSTFSRLFWPEKKKKL